MGKLKLFIGSVIRTGLAFGGGVLVAKGVIDKETADATTEAIAGPSAEIIVGVLSWGIAQLASLKNISKIVPYIPKF